MNCAERMDYTLLEHFMKSVLLQTCTTDGMTPEECKAVRAQVSRRRINLDKFTLSQRNQLDDIARTLNRLKDEVSEILSSKESDSGVKAKAPRPQKIDGPLTDAPKSATHSGNMSTSHFGASVTEDNAKPKYQFQALEKYPNIQSCKDAKIGAAVKAGTKRFQHPTFIEWCGAYNLAGIPQAIVYKLPFNIPDFYGAPKTVITDFEGLWKAYFEECKTYTRNLTLLHKDSTAVFQVLDYVIEFWTYLVSFRVAFTHDGFLDTLTAINQGRIPLHANSPELELVERALVAIQWELSILGIAIKSER